MYWFRDANLYGLVAWATLCVICWLGGWLLATHLFRLRSRERLLSGLAIGLLLWIVFSNLLGLILGKVIARWQPGISLVFWGAAFLILGLGILSASLRRKNGGKLFDGWLSKEDLNAWPQLLALTGLLIISSLINRGLAIFDDYYNLPIVSRMAAGDIPPHFHLNPENWLVYHYGLHLLAAGLVRIGNMFPWSAFDLAKSLSLSLTVVLAWLWFHRTIQTRNVNASRGAIWGSLLVLLGGGARWLLLFLPQGMLSSMGSGLRLLGSALATGPDLVTLLASPWKIEGGGPFPFPFAFTNGIFAPLNMAMGSSGAIAQMTVVLLLLLARKRWRPFEGIVIGLLLASLALTSEHIFALILAGMAICALWVILSGASHKQVRQAFRQVGNWLWAIIPATLLALLAGGVITEVLRSVVHQMSGTAIMSSGYNGLGFRWPPAITSSHFGPLALNNPWQLLIALAEIGATIILAPMAIRWARQRAHGGKWTPAWFVAGSLLSFLISVFIYYGVERDTSRLIGSALFLWILLGFPLAWSTWEKVRGWGKTFLAICYSIAILGGIAMLIIEVIAISRPQFTYFVDTPDAQLSQAYWDQLDPDTQIFDPLPFRAVTLFGRAAGHAYEDTYIALPEWLDLMQDPTPERLAQVGYSYVYLDKETWQSLTPDTKSSYQQSCVKQLAEQITDDKDFRRLIDIRACQ